MNPRCKTAPSMILILLAGVAPLFAQEQREIDVRTTRLSENVYMLAGAGGNIALLAGDDGALLVDADYEHEPLSAKIAAAVGEVSDEPVRMLINTHWHFDHVGGNEFFHEAGATIAAHANVRERMSQDQDIAHIDAHPPASPPAALPTITYTTEMTMHWSGEEVRIVHAPLAHTDGDSLILFRKANVLHVGDVCFAGMYPFLDVNAGGTIDGMIGAMDRALELANEKTKVIPGHGPLSTVADLREYRAMLISTRDAVRALVKQDKTCEETVAAKPTKALDDKWGGGGFGPDIWVEMVYDAMTRKPDDRSRKPIKD